MIFTISMMRQIEWLVTILIICSVSGHGIYNLREEAETEPNMDDNTQPERRQEYLPCGRRQIPLSKRDEGQGGSNDHDQSDHLDKILGGSDVTPGQVPWHVNIYHKGVRKCAGAILGEYWIITSAYCATASHKRDIKLVLGDHQLSVNESWQDTRDVHRIVIHFGYRRGNLDYDIALIAVSTKNYGGIRFNNYIQPICLPDVGERLPINTNLTVSGFGDPNITTPHNQSSDTLQTAVLPVDSYNLCYDNTLCLLRTDIAACVGDLGGPATYQSGRSHVLAGLIDVKSDCGPSISPIRLVDIALYRTWIDDRINAYGKAKHKFIPWRED